jgi:hypothetical protein
MHLLIKIPFSWKTSFLGLHQRIETINKITISKTGLKITIGSNDLVEDISFKVDNRLNVEKNGNLVIDDEDKKINNVNQLRTDSKTVFYIQ